MSNYPQDELPVGFHLVEVRPHAQTRHYDVNPDYVSLHAAAMALHSQLCGILMECMTPMDWDALTEEQQHLILQLRKTGLLSVHWPSISDIAQKFVEKLEQAVQQAHTNDWVRDLAEQYQAALRLTISNE
jgi:hypothetical protein